MRTIELGATGEKIPLMGQGAWGIKTWGSQEHCEQWKRSLRRGIELGMTHIDTADAHDATIQQIAIAWLINHENVITIPKAFHVEHVEANAEAADITLSKKEMELLNTVST